MRKVIEVPKIESQPSYYNFSQNISLPDKFEFQTTNDAEAPPPNTIWDALYDLNYEELSTLLKDENLNSLDSQGYSLINRCILLQMIRTNALPKFDGKYYEMLIFLIGKGCDVNFRGNARNQFTPLHLVINPKVGLIEHTNRKLNEVRIKCDIQRKINDAAMDPVTKMSLIFDRKIDIIKLLLQNGALNLTDNNGFDPIMIANNLAEKNKNVNQTNYRYYCEIYHLLSSHFSLTVLNTIHSTILCTPRLLAASVKHGVPNLIETSFLISRFIHREHSFTYTFVCELAHRFFINDNNIALNFNDNFKTIFYILQYFELENFLYYFCYETRLKGSPLKSSIRFNITLSEIGEFQLYSFSNVIVYLDNDNNFNWILPYTIIDHLSRVEGMFPLFHSLLTNKDFDVSQIGPFFIDFISHINPDSELATAIPYLLVRYFIMLELWVLYRPEDESRIYHLKEDLVNSSIFTYTTLAHYLLNNFQLFDTIRIKTSFPLQFSQVASLWKKNDKSTEDISLDSKMHIFLKILETISFQINNRDSLNNSCLHILARLKRVDFIFFLLDNLGAYPFVLNSNCLTFLDIYRGINSDAKKGSEVANGIEKLERYFSKPYTLRTLSGYVLSRHIDVLKFLDPPTNILKFVLLHLKPESCELFEIQPKCKNINKIQRKHRVKHTTDKKVSPSENRIHFDAFSVPEESTPTMDCIKFNPGII